jgi:hypothetical protein
VQRHGRRGRAGMLQGKHFLHSLLTVGTIDRHTIRHGLWNQVPRHGALAWSAFLATLPDLHLQHVKYRPDPLALSLASRSP